MKLEHGIDTPAKVIFKVRDGEVFCFDLETQETIIGQLLVNVNTGKCNLVSYYGAANASELAAYLKCANNFISAYEELANYSVEDDD